MSPDKPVHRVVTDKEYFLSIKKQNIIYQGKKMFVLGPLNLICQVRLYGGWSGIGMVNFRFLKQNLKEEKNF